MGENLVEKKPTRLDREHHRFVLMDIQRRILEKRE